jgi:hypothetical protein
MDAYLTSNWCTQVQYYYTMGELIGRGSGNSMAEMVVCGIGQLCNAVMGVAIVQIVVYSGYTR